MSKILQWLATYIGLPLLEKLGSHIASWFKDFMEQRKIKKEHEELKKKLENATDEEEIRAINRKLGL
jgi:hypothetical protein